MKRKMRRNEAFKVMARNFGLPLGMLLRYVPLASVIVAVSSLTFACLESRAAQQAREAEDQAIADKVDAEWTANELSRRMPEEIKETMVGELRLAPGTTVQQLEKQAREEPENAEIQRKAFLLRTLREPNRPITAVPRREP